MGVVGSGEWFDMMSEIAVDGTSVCQVSVVNA